MDGRRPGPVVQVCRNVLAAMAFAVFPCAEGPGQEVRSADSASEVSEFLRPPGQSAYGGPTDWSRLPDWRKTSFFGVRAEGRVFVFVVDCSGSMEDELRLVRAKAELRRSIGALRWPQRFLVIFYNERPFAQPGGFPEPAHPGEKDRLFRWFRNIEPGGSTDPRGAMSQALALRPDAVFLLSDGLFPEGSVESIAASNVRGIPIHCIDLAGGAGGEDLKAIAEASGGQYAPRP